MAIQALLKILKHQQEALLTYETAWFYPVGAQKWIAFRSCV
jgi:hypothetical protein